MRLLGNTSSFSVADDKWPPGFRFHPTDEELVLYYLKRKMCRLRLKLDAIAEVDVYKADPEELPGLSKLKNGDRQWFFFSPRDRKYPNGGRSNRATRHGYWKATGKDRVITCSSRSVGIKKTLVFYKGRSPSGERTDWVMHEYTLVEEELKRCPAPDYYALYKVYKKSGPGPKNGEQYGALFREEDWADDVKAVDSVDTTQVPPLQQFGQHASLDNTGTNCQAQTQISGLDEFLNQVANDFPFELISEVFGTVQAAGGDEEAHRTSVDQSLVEANVQERGFINPPCRQFNNPQPCSDPNQSDNSQFHETSEVTSASNINRQVSHNYEEGRLEDFLELDDLIVPEFTNQNIENPVDNLRIEDFDGLFEPEFFQDVSTVLQNVGDTETASFTYNNDLGSQICNSIPISSPNNLENGVVEQVPNSYFMNFQSEMVQPISQPYHAFVDNEMVNQFDYQVPHDSNVASEPWMHNHNFSVAAPAAANQGSLIPPTSGVIYDGVNQNQFQNENQNQTHIQNQNFEGSEGGQSWFSSFLWSFLETIPTTPASAAEGTVLVNKALERLSSFGRRGESVKVSKLNTSANAGNLTDSHQRSRNGYNRGFLLFSVFGVLCAILWVFTVTSVRVSGGCLS